MPPLLRTDLYPHEGISSLVKRTVGNPAAASLDQLATAENRSFKKIQYRPHIVDGCLAGAGLTMDD